MKQIELTQNKVALVDDEDFDWLNQWKWCVRVKSTNLFYAGRNNWYDGKSHILTMHRQIMCPTQKQEVDHINGDGLDNRRTNLRICNHSQNQKNQACPKNNKCGYKGVHWNKSSKKWRAVIFVDGNRIHCGVYFCIKDAAKAYNEAAIKYHGKFARLNSV